MAKSRRRWGWIVLGLLAAGGLALWLKIREAPPDTRFNGAYRLADGRLVLVAPREGPVLRYRLLDGESRALWPRGGNRFEAGPGWAGEKPVVLTVTFTQDAERGATGLAWAEGGKGSQRAERLHLPESGATFRSDGLALRAKLVTPSGPGPFPLVVFVHGSERDSAVDHYFEPYLFAAHGIAALVYDKRGTGKSEGKYTQNFHALARDAAAAVRWARGRREVDPQRIHLAGFSQGGWIAPLAARQVGGIRSLLIGYGPMVPVADEDRWGYVYELRRKGFGDAEVARADRLNATLEAIVDRGENRWAQLGQQLKAAKKEPWLEAAAGSDSMLGFVAGTKAPLWVIRLYAWWKLRPAKGEPFVERHYDPVPTMAELAVPSLWMLGGQDSSMPTQWTIDKLETLKRAGRPIEVRLYPHAEHGILRVEDDGKGGHRVIGYEPDYFPSQVEWVRRWNGPTQEG